VGRRGAIAQRRRSDVTAAVALEWDAQQPLPGFAPRVRDSLPRVERDAYDELTPQYDDNGQRLPDKLIRKESYGFGLKESKNIQNGSQLLYIFCE
jgi:hypothetical protein